MPAHLKLFGTRGKDIGHRQLVILEAITLLFGDKVRFSGAFDGVVTLTVVIVSMLLAEEAIVRLYRRLGDKEE